MQLLTEGDAEWVELMAGPPLSVIADTLRPMIQAEPGSVLMARDLSQIEARVARWLSGDEKGLDAFRAYDAGTGPDIYVTAAAGIYNVPPSAISKDDPRRQVGKVADLALGFAGGAVALAKMSKVYRVDLAPLYDSLMGLIDADMLGTVDWMWNKFGRGAGMSERSYYAAEIIKQRWRAANPLEVQFWKDVEDAAINAVIHPGQVYTAGPHVRFRKTGSFLRAALPSGRAMWFPFPRIESSARANGGAKHSLNVMGVDGLTNKWVEYSMYGGSIVQNLVQGTARDIMAEALVRQEKAGYHPVLTIHDESVAEVKEGFGSEAEFARLFIESPEWAVGLPISSDGWVGKEYRK